MRAILVTGANGGLGQAIARAFLSESPKNFVWLCVHYSEEHARKLLEESPRQCGLCRLDVTDRSAWDAVIKQVLEQHHRIDVLVNNAGGHRDGLLATLDPATWDEVLSMNLNSV